MILRDKLARLLHNQWRGKIETWEGLSEFRQSQYLEKAEEIIKLVAEGYNSFS